MKLFNYFFYILLFIGFFLPTNSNFYIPLSGVLLTVNELAFLLLPFINILCTSKNQIRFKDLKLKKNIFILLLLIVFTEVIVKGLLYNQSIGEAFKTIRIGLPLFSSLVLLAQGLRVDKKVVWKVLLWAVISSVILSIASLFINLPIYNDLETGESVLQMLQGRFMNSNSVFGVIGLYLLFMDKDKWYNQGYLVKIASVLSVLSLILSFNRTYLAILVLEFLYLSFSTFSLKNVFKLIFVPIFFFGIGIWSYNNIDLVQRQIDKRILSIIFGQVSLYESTVKGNRDVIYEGIYERISEGHWVIGLPYDKPIFIRKAMYGKDQAKMTVTDTSFVNVILNYGIVPMIILVLIFKKISKYKSKIFLTCMIFYLIASLNIDSLMSQNSIFFIILMFLVSFKVEKYSI